MRTRGGQELKLAKTYRTTVPSSAPRRAIRMFRIQDTP